MSQRDDRRLVKRLKARDERAFRDLVERYQDRVFNVVYRLLGNREEAEDVSQEVFITVFKAIDRFRGDSKLSTWLYRVSANHAKNRIKYLARRRAKGRASLEDISDLELQASSPTHNPAPDRVAIGHQLEAQLQQALATLDDDYRLVIVLRDVESLSYEEIAEITDVALGTVKSRLHRARAALKTALNRVQRRGLKHGN